MTKKAQTERCQEILHRVRPGEKISGSDHDFLLSVFQQHREWDLKRGVGIDYITVNLTTHGNKCFFLHRTDGSVTDISFHKAIKGFKPVNDVIKACREAIDPEVKQFRQANVVYYSTRCPITGQVLTPETTHIDHYDSTFSEVFNQWSTSYDVNYLFSQVNTTEDLEDRTYFVNDDLAEDFRQFHNNHTHLRAVSKEANLKILRKKNNENEEQ